MHYEHKPAGQPGSGHREIRRSCTENARFVKTILFSPCFSLSPFYSAGSPASADRRRVTMEVPIWGPEGTDQTHSGVKFSQTRRGDRPATPFACCYVGG